MWSTYPRTRWLSLIGPPSFVCVYKPWHPIGGERVSATPLVIRILRMCFSSMAAKQFFQDSREWMTPWTVLWLSPLPSKRVVTTWQTMALGGSRASLQTHFRPWSCRLPIFFPVNLLPVFFPQFMPITRRMASIRCRGPTWFCLPPPCPSIPRSTWTNHRSPTPVNTSLSLLSL